MSFESFLGELRADADELVLRLPPGAVDCAVCPTSLDGEPAPKDALGRPVAEAPPHAYRELQEELGLARVVLVQPDLPGIDIEMLLKMRAALATSPDGLVEDCARVFARIDPDEDPVRLAELSEEGIDGMQLTMLHGRLSCPWDGLDRHVRRTFDVTGWNRELSLDGSDLHELEQMIRDWPGETILSDIGGFRFSRSLTQPGFRALRRLIDRGRLWVRLSSPHRIARDGATDDPEVDALAAALVDWAPERMIWGTGWPQYDRPAEAESEASSGADFLGPLGRWVGAADIRRQVLCSNPEELFGFDTWPVSD